MSDFGSISLRRLLDAFPDALLGSHADVGDATATLDPAQLVPVMCFLRDDEATAFEMLMDLTAVDHLENEPGAARFELVYHLYSLSQGQRLRIKARVPEAQPRIASLTGLWASADWMEREVFDLYGVRFEGHPDLRRILLYDEFEGHPLRKDYPKTGRQPLIGPRN